MLNQLPSLRLERVLGDCKSRWKAEIRLSLKGFCGLNSANPETWLGDHIEGYGLLVKVADLPQVNIGTCFIYGPLLWQVWVIHRNVKLLHHGLRGQENLLLSKGWRIMESELIRIIEANLIVKPLLWLSCLIIYHVNQPSTILKFFSSLRVLFQGS